MLNFSPHLFVNFLVRTESRKTVKQSHFYGLELYPVLSGAYSTLKAYKCPILARFSLKGRTSVENLHVSTDIFATRTVIGRRMQPLSTDHDLSQSVG